MRIRSFALFVFALSLPRGAFGAAATQAYEPTILEYLRNDGRFTTFLHYAKFTGDESWLKTRFAAGCTVLAPTNAAFSEVSPSVWAALQKKPAEFEKLIEYHIVPREQSAEQVRLGPKTVEGDLLSLTGGVPKRTARIISPDLQADNGRIQIIDRVLFPPSVVLDLQRDGTLPIATGLPIHGHMTLASVNQSNPAASSYAAARRRARKNNRWLRHHT